MNAVDEPDRARWQIEESLARLAAAVPQLLRAFERLRAFEPGAGEGGAC